ncbi:unnamed protein product [Sphenostylis stenocarpa]|uniref:DUF3741 domain-containing protein n=1 Tax=Sphenostylis stenocarpa TaxID=92480 RepID=A0AA86RZU2_9FABA|nr:unnamed protein product [Sphenostylis stenocarpa]
MDDGSYNFTEGLRFCLFGRDWYNKENALRVKKVGAILGMKMTHVHDILIFESSQQLRQLCLKMAETTFTLTKLNGNMSPMHPNSNPITKQYATEVVHGHNKDAMINVTKPGVVARLMGLDSLPSTNLVPSTNTPDSVPRSRSVNFVDYLLKFDTSQANHHQVKTSASFREVPAPFDQHNNKKTNRDLVVLYWDSGSEDHKVESLLRIPEMGLEESRQRKKQGSKNKEIVGVTKEKNLIKRKKISKFKNEPRVVPLKHGSKVRNHNEAKVLAPVSAFSKSCSSNRRKGTNGPSGSRTSSTLPNKQKKVLSEPKQSKKPRKQQSTKKIETECSSENFSPISVLNDYDFSFLYGPDFPDYTSSLTPKTEWEFSRELFLDDNVGNRASKDKEYSSPDINNKKECLSELTVKLCKCTENDLTESDFTRKHMCEGENYEDICWEYEHKILDILLHEFVNELVELSY